MDLIDRIRDLAAQVPRLKGGDLIKTEEGTKNALIMPFIQALGYNVFDPTEVTPELVADVGTKKGEKVDYAVLKDGKPIMLFECKCCGTNLSEVHASQLYRYFSVTEARFGILTDGVVYYFYTDLDAPNKMDAKPFFVFSLLEVTDAAVAELKKFAKSTFDPSQIMTTASELKYKRAIKVFLAAQLVAPSDEFVRLLLEGSQVHSGRKTQHVIEEYRDVARDAFQQFVNEQIEQRFKTLVAGNVNPVQQEKKDEEAASAAPSGEKSKVETTQEETDAFYIIRAIVRAVVDVKRITMRDAQSYCAILLDDNNRRPVARLYLDGSKQYLGLFNAEKVEERVPISCIDDIYQYADRLKATAIAYTN
jgi:hypothetical protein